MSVLKPVKIGIIGVGNISPAYINGSRLFDILQLDAVADLNMDRARSVATDNNIPRSLSVDEMLADPDIEIVINLTIPAVHAEITRRILSAGKHAYSEKPLATTLDDARGIVQLAQQTGLRVGCAPDTFLFAEHQTVRKLLDEGAIGVPVAATGFAASRGPESWHPNPDFFYQPGGGPLLDIGPYWITCLVTLLGPVARVSGAAKSSFAERIAKDGHHIPVQVPTHVTGVLEFESGAVATLMVSFDVVAHHLPRMEVFGALSTIRVPDPNGYDPAVLMYAPELKTWIEQQNPFRTDWRRGIGVADMAHAIQSGRPHRANLDLAFHTLEVMDAMIRAGETQRYVDIESRCERPAPLPLGLDGRVLD